ncbi:MAG: preprotein translocase subunit SecG [Acidobacteria bacterium]|nr:preprotein translocase subunit SecG [Acidobacteriota bacterium]
MPGNVKWAISLVAGAALIVLGWRVPFVLTTVHVLVSFLLVVVVLLQSGKAADLAGAFGGAGSQTAFGPRGAATFLSKATTWCAVMFMLTSIALGLRQTTFRPAGSSVLEQFSKPAPKQQPAPAAPAPQQPAQPQQSAPQTPPAHAPASPPPAKQ